MQWYAERIPITISYSFQISSMKCGLLPLSQESALIGDVSYHSYNGIVIDPNERDSLAKDLGPNNKVRGLNFLWVVKKNNEVWYYSVFNNLSCEQYRLVTQLLSIDVAHVSWGKRFRSCHSIRLKMLLHPLFHVTDGIIYLPQLNFSDLRISHF